MDKLDLKSVTLEELRKFTEEKQEPQFRASQILDWLYSRKTSHRVDTLQQMDNLGKGCIEKLFPLIYITSLSICDDLSIGLVHKYIFRTEDNNLVPTVLVKDRLILSTQIGCSYNCKFCASGKHGLVRNLTTGEIVDQVVKVQNQLGSTASFAKVELAGMGEPLANYQAVIKAIEIIRSKWGLSFFLRNVSLATCGIAPKIKELAETPVAVDLVISFHAIQDEVRSSLMPVNKEYPVETILDAVKHYSRMTGCTITFDYMLLEGLNDSLADAKFLTSKLRGVPVKLRISSFNPVPRVKFTTPRTSWQEQFAKILTAGNINAELVKPFGTDIKAGYGQLGTEKQKKQKVKSEKYL